MPILRWHKVYGLRRTEKVDIPYLQALRLLPFALRPMPFALSAYRRKGQLKRRTGAYLAVDFNAAAIVFHDPVADADTQSGAFADFFGRKKGFNNFIFNLFGHPGARIGNQHHDLLTFHKGFDGKLFCRILGIRLAAFFIHGIDGIRNQVDKYLLQPVVLRHNIRQIRVQIELAHRYRELSTDGPGP